MRDDFDLNHAEGEDEPEEGREGVKVNLRKIVAFELDDELYGVDIGMVAEIIRLATIRPLPNVPEFILGLINIRGSIVPVIDLRICFQLQRQPWDAESRIIVMQDSGVLAGVVADRLGEMLRLPPAAFQPPPVGTNKTNAEYFKEVSLIDDRLLIILDMKKIFNETKRG